MLPLTLCAYMKKGPNLRWSLIQCSGGDEGDRTPDLLTASQALSQLSYAPVRRSTIRELERRCKDIFGKTFRGGIAAAPRAARGGQSHAPEPRPSCALDPRARRLSARARARNPTSVPTVRRRPHCRPHCRVRSRATPPRRPKSGAVYYDDSRTVDHAAVFANTASALPAVLQTENGACSRVANSS